MRHASRRPLKNPRLEANVFRGRAIAALLVAALLAIVLSAWYFHLQVGLHELYRTRSEANRIKTRPLAPPRGLILDRNGRLLADNVPAYRLELVPEQVHDLNATLAELARILPIDADELERFHAARRASPAFQPVALKLKMSEAEVARFAVNRHRFDGVDVVPYLTRQYPQRELTAHVVGYVGRLDSADLEALSDRRYAALSHIGKTGIERFYEARLRGEVGYEQVEQNVRGRDLRVVDRQPAQPGQDLLLSLDLDLQAAAIAAFGGQHGAAVVIDPRSGEVLALVSLPAYDPNPFVHGIARAAYAELLASPSRPLFDRALMGGYEPGSTIKPFLAVAGLALGVRRSEDRVFSSGAFHLAGAHREYRDWRQGGHGWVDLPEALAQSVNTYFYMLAQDLGIDRMSGYLGRFGFGRATGIDLPTEGAGILPSREWKRAVRGQPWFPGETVIAGIGQGYWVATPLQLAQATAVIAGGGVRRRPHLLRAVRAVAGAAAEPLPSPAPETVTDPQWLEPVREGMMRVMHGATGTARASGAGAAYPIAGKTGTAQRVSRRGSEQLKLEDLPFDLRHRALFIGFAPGDAPTIALALVMESGGSGSRASAPVARRIFDFWLARPEGLRAQTAVAPPAKAEPAR